MSGISNSLTLSFPPERLDQVLENLDGGPDVPGVRMLHASGRNHHLEHNLRLLLKEYPQPGLTYLRTWAEMEADRGPWRNLLQEPELGQAIQGWERFLEEFRAHPEAGLQAWPAPDPEPLHRPWPTDLTAATRWLAERCREWKGETLECCLAYAWAHLLTLRQAQQENLAVLYAVQLHQ